MGVFDLIFLLTRKKKAALFSLAGFQFRCGSKLLSGVILLSTLLIGSPLAAQDWIKTGTGLGVEKVRLAASDFKASNQDPKNAELLKVFNDTLWNDLDNAGIFDMVSKSFYPLG